MGLTARALVAGYGGQCVLDGVDVAAAPGELLAVVGPNGSGKTTLLRALSGVLSPDAGEVALNGVPLSAMAAPLRARKIGFVPQSRPPDFAFTVREMVEMGRTPYLGRFGRLHPADVKAVDGALRRVGIEALADKDASVLSAGQVQLVVLARALAQEPSILLLDEPTAHLDLTHQIEVMEAVRSLVRNEKMAAVAVLHDLNLAAAYGDRILVLARGRVRAQGTPAAVLTRAHIAAGFGVDVIVRRHPVTGAVYVVPFAVSAPAQEQSAPASGRGRVHVVCGGGTGAQVMSDLVRAGFEVSVGVVNVLDSDFEVAQSLGVQVVAEAPFSAVSVGALEEARKMAASCEAVVLSAVPIGPSNVSNLSLLEAAAGDGRQRVVVDPAGAKDRDFTGGEATRRVERLLEGGAVGLDSPGAVAAHLQRVGSALAPPPGA